MRCFLPFLNVSKLVLFLRQDTSVFTLADVQEMEAIISTFNAFETKETGPLILAWAVFLCLISSLPGKEESNVLMVCGPALVFYPIPGCMNDTNNYCT